MYRTSRIHRVSLLQSGYREDRLVSPTSQSRTYILFVDHWLIELYSPTYCTLHISKGSEDIG